MRCSNENPTILFPDPTKISLTFSVLFFSGVIQVAASARGQIVWAWHAMTITNAHVKTRVIEANAQPRHSLVTHFASTVMATAAVQKQDLDS